MRLLAWASALSPVRCWRRWRRDLEKQDELEHERNLRLLYRACFLETEAGKAVLAHLLAELGYAGEVNGAEDEIRRNVAVELLMRLGVLDDFSFPTFVEALVTVPLAKMRDERRTPRLRRESMDRIARWKEEV